MQPSLIASFVVRLFCDQPAEGESEPCWRVVVRHVQTGEERQFQRPADALAFLEEVTAGSPPLSPSPSGQPDLAP